MSGDIIKKSMVYKLISVGFLYPENKWYERITGVFNSLKNNNEFFELNNTIEMYKDRLHELQSEHTRLFGSAPVCSLNVTDYTAKHDFMAAQQMADISGFYKAFGLTIRENERMDNLSICFEFLSYLLLKLAHADTDEKKEIVKNAFNKFLNSYIIGFTEKFSANLMTNTENVFYRNLTFFTGNFLKGEQMGTAPIS